MSSSAGPAFGHGSNAYPAVGSVRRLQCEHGFQQTTSWDPSRSEHPEFESTTELGPRRLVVAHAGTKGSRRVTGWTHATARRSTSLSADAPPALGGRGDRRRGRPGNGEHTRTSPDDPIHGSAHRSVTHGFPGTRRAAGPVEKWQPTAPLDSSSRSCPAGTRPGRPPGVPCALTHPGRPYTAQAVSPLVGRMTTTLNDDTDLGGS